MFGLPEDGEMEVKKYKNCVCYKIEGYQIVWYYEGNFYFGEFSTTDGISEKSGFGIEINPLSTSLFIKNTFMRGRFERDPKKATEGSDTSTTTTMKESG